jgi:hypothetical protein
MSKTNFSNWLSRTLDSVHTIIILVCLLLAKRFGVLQYF